MALHVLGLVREGHLARVPDKDVASQDVAPAVFGGTQAEVVLLAITTAEPLFVKEADLIDAGATDVQAETDTRRYIHGAARVHASCKAVQLVVCQLHL